jgi:hypothetical protein
MNRRKLNRISLLLLLLGFGSALVIFLTAEPVRVDPLLGDPLASRKYRRELRVLGGRANVAAAEFQAWFGSLWHGEALAGTVAVLTVGGTLVFRFFATFPPPDPTDTPEPTRRPPGPT